MLKKVFLVLVIILAFLFASIYIFRANIKQYAITTILKSFPLPNVALANVNFDETTGKLNLEEIRVKNPSGFKSRNIMEADSVDMDISFTTKPNLRLNISDIDVTKPVFYVERSAGGNWNFQEYIKRSRPSSAEKEKGFDIIREAFAEEAERKSEVILPRNININNGTVHFLDSFVTYGRTHAVDLLPITGTISLQYLPEKDRYEKILFDGSCNVDGNSSSIIRGNLEVSPEKKNPTYRCKFNAYNVPLATVKPYLDRYTPFVVRRGSFNMASEVRSVDGAIDGNHTMELMNLEFAINSEKSNSLFLETSVKKLTLYLTNQRGNVVIDFRQKGRAGEKVRWSLGPIAKRAIGLMAIDTVIDIIEGAGKSGQGDIIKEVLPKDIPPEVIDIFKGILR